MTKNTSGVLLLRSIALSVIALLFCLSQAFADHTRALYPLSVDDYVTLVDKDGNEAIPPSTYSDIISLTAADGSATGYFSAVPLAIVQSGDADYPRYALLDTSGTPLTPYIYYDIQPAGSSHFIVCESGDQYGVIDTLGSTVIPSEYTAIGSNGEGGFLALRTNPYDDTPDGLYFIGADGTESATGVKIRGDIYALNQMRGGLLPAFSPTDNAYGYIGADGRWMINPQFEWAGAFVHGMADVSIATGVGVINTQGSWIITPKYKSVMISYGIKPWPIVAYEEDRLTVFDETGERVIITATGEAAYASPSDAELIAISSGSESDIYDFYGNKLFSLPENYFFSAWDSMADIIIYDEQYRALLYDRTGTLICGPYDELLFIENSESLYIFSAYETRAVDYGDGMVYHEPIYSTYRMGVVNGKGDVVINAVFDRISILCDDRLIGTTPGSIVIMDHSGTVIKEFQRYAQLMD